MDIEIKLNINVPEDLNYGEMRISIKELLSGEELIDTISNTIIHERFKHSLNLESYLVEKDNYID
jgi:hypothetical protein